MLLHLQSTVLIRRSLACSRDFWGRICKSWCSFSLITSLQTLRCIQVVSAWRGDEAVAVWAVPTHPGCINERDGSRLESSLFSSLCSFASDNWRRRGWKKKLKAAFKGMKSSSSGASSRFRLIKLHALDGKSVCVCARVCASVCVCVYCFTWLAAQARKYWITLLNHLICCLSRPLERPSPSTFHCNLLEQTREVNKAESPRTTIFVLHSWLALETKLLTQTVNMQRPAPLRSVNTTTSRRQCAACSQVALLTKAWCSTTILLCSGWFFLNFIPSNFITFQPP